MPIIVMSLKDLHHHGGDVIKAARRGDTVALYNERRGLLEAVLRPPTAAELEAIAAQLAVATEEVTT